MTDMKRRVFRRPRGTLSDPLMLGYEVERTHKERWDALATSLEMSPSELFDVMVDNLQLDGYGRPLWLPARPLKDGVLDIGQVA